MPSGPPHVCVTAASCTAGNRSTSTSHSALWTEAYVETYDLQPIDRPTNGPQLFYGLRYHEHIVKPGEIEMFHEQVGFLL